MSAEQSPPLITKWGQVSAVLHAGFTVVVPINFVVVLVPGDCFLAITANQNPINFGLRWVHRGLRVSVVIAHLRRPPFQLL